MPKERALERNSRHFAVLRFLVRQSAVRFDCQPEARERVPQQDRPTTGDRLKPPGTNLGKTGAGDVPGAGPDVQKLPGLPIPGFQSVARGNERGFGDPHGTSDEGLRGAGDRGQRSDAGGSARFGLRTAGTQRRGQDDHAAPAAWVCSGRRPARPKCWGIGAGSMPRRSGARSATCRRIRYFRVISGRSSISISWGD